MRCTAVVLMLLLSGGILAEAQNQVTPLHLTLEDAITQALKANLGVRVANTQRVEADGARERASSPLLPRITADHVTSFQNRNLQALGLSMPGLPIPAVVGPFSNYDYRVFASQAIIDRQAYHTWKSSERQQVAASLTYQDTRDLVIRQAGGLYFEAEAAQAQVEADEARVTTSEALLKLAQDQHSAGLATAVDVVREQVQLQRDQQTLLVARDNYETSILNLERYLGIRPGEPLELAEKLEFKAVELPDLDEAITAALKSRSDYRSLMSQREAVLEQQRASRARYLPKFSVDGNYGALGRSYGTMPGIGLIEGVISIDVFDRDRSGEKKELASQVGRIDSQIADLERGIEQDVRKAALDLQSAAQQVSVTQSGLDLAQRELDLARDRFKNGLTDNIEVITAQTSLQSAEDDHIAALARHSDAALALARALGATEGTYRKYVDVSPTGATQEKGLAHP